MTRSTSRRRRAGRTLLELLATFTVLAAVLSLSGVMIARMSHANRRLRTEMVGDVGLSRMLADLRRQIHSSSDASVAGDTLRLELPAGEIQEYRARRSRLERLEAREGAAVVADAAGLPAGPAQWRVDGRLVSLTVDTSSPAAQVDFAAALGSAVMGSQENAP